MTARRKLAPADLPYWPRGLNRELAAAYVGVSVNKFLEEVEAGIWPAGTRRGGNLIWDRVELDARFDQVSQAAGRSREEEMVERAKQWA